MRRLWVALALCGMLAVLCILPLRSVTAFCEKTEERLETCVQLVQSGDSAAAAARATEIQSDFRRWQPRANTYLRHSELDPVQEVLTELTACAEAADWAEFVISCRRAQELVRHLSEAEQPNWGNLL